MCIVCANVVKDSHTAQSTQILYTTPAGHYGHRGNVRSTLPDLQYYISFVAKD
jgi:hypothetical protein